MENGGFDGLNNKQKKQSAFNMLVHETSKFMTQISEELSVSPELSSAINEENVNEMRKLIECNNESMSEVLDGIIKANKHELLKNFISDMEDLENQIIPVIQYSIKRLALNCVRTLQDIGIKISEDESEAIIKIALTKVDSEVMKQFIKEENTETLKEYLFKAVYESADAVETILGILEARLKSLNLSTITNHQGDSLLHVAARSSSPSSESVMTLLIERELQLLELENKDKRTPLHVAAYAQRVDNCKFLMSRKANLAQVDKSGEVILKTIFEKAPRAMSEFKKRLDDGLVLVKNDNKIDIDFSTIFGCDKGKISRKEHEMVLFEALAESPEPFRSYVEHPLCEAFVSYKYEHIKHLFWIFSAAPHFIFSAIFSIYSILIFGHLCAPDDEDNGETRWQWNQTIDCHRNTSDNQNKFNTATVAWVVLVILTIIFILRDFIELMTHYKYYFIKWKNIQNLYVDVLLLCVLYNGNPHEELKYQRWQYHVAILTSFLLWFQMMMVSGEFPGLGKYVHMFTSVCLKMMKLFLFYIWLIIGFMTAFMIFFSGDRKYSDPFLSLVTMIVWMLGELEYADILFPNDEVTKQKKIYIDTRDGNEINEETCDIDGNNCMKRYVGEIETKDDYLQFSGTAQVFFIAYVLLFSIVIMNLLIGLSVSDIADLKEKAQKASIISQIKMINGLMHLRTTVVYRYCVPSNIQKIFERMLQVNEEFKIKEVSYSDATDKQFKPKLKQRLYEHCIRKEENEMKEYQQHRIERIENQLEKIMVVLQNLQQKEE